MNSLCLDFINSRSYMRHIPVRDPLDDHTWLIQIGSSYDLPEICSLSNRSELKTFRSLMLQALLGLCRQHKLEPSFLLKINEILACIHPQQILVPEEEGYCLQIQHHCDDLTWIKYKIALSFSQLIANQPLDHLKKCQNPECDWIFYDDSKNHTRKWCSNRCASLMKVRRFRAAKNELNR